MPQSNRPLPDHHRPVLVEPSDILRVWCAERRWFYYRDALALDLATTPAALRRAVDQVELYQLPVSSDVSYPPLPREYTPLVYISPLEYPPPGGSSRSFDPRLPEVYIPLYISGLHDHFPRVHQALSSFERKTLRPLVLRQSRSEPIFITARGELPSTRSTRPLHLVSDPLLPPHHYRVSHSLEALDLRGVIKLNTMSYRFADFSSFCMTVKWAGEERCNWKQGDLPLRYSWRRFLLIGFLGVIWTIWTIAFWILITLRPSEKLRRIVAHVDQGVCGVVAPGPTPCEIIPNPDIAGIGGRIALYIQAFMLPVTLVFSDNDDNAASWALTTTALALNISAIVTAVTSQITLYHVILVTQFQNLLLYFVGFVEPYSPPSRGPFLFLLSRNRWLIATAITFWYTITAPCFGSQTECNVDVRVSSYNHNALAVSPDVRPIQMAHSILISTVIIFGYIWDWRRCGMALKAIFSKSARRAWAHPIRAPVPYLNTTAPNSAGVFIAAPLRWYIDDSPVRLLARTTFTPQRLPRPVSYSMSHNKRRFILRYLRHRLSDFRSRAWLVIRTPKLQRFVIALPLVVVAIWDIEHTIDSNTVAPGENAWTYGQVLALLLAAVPVFQVLQLFGWFV
ncbi:hypothetical protein JAAARDRAFT_40761 [Jaapia argillacea MUCL 33604]|uniref:Uncharacterized protein n=1 Tax=Jaapia argillacea MUCL 33604 TaxID=933084 RepID=A0A067PN41_9AGAM|nr:hypothetical protein JAAARDRAFT_40761 [Jaapia argillacea MUCL 33604]